MIADKFPHEASFSFDDDLANAYMTLRDHATELDRLARKVANLNPACPEIGAGMLAQLVEDARRITKQ